jgi:hypothetical protein
MDVLENLWDKATGVFEKWADLEIRETELKLESELAVNRLQLQALQQPQSTGFIPQGTVGPGISLATVAILAGGGLAVWFLLKKA